MSAFRFVTSAEKLQKMTNDELTALRGKLFPVIKNFDWSKYQQTHFESDRASGYRATVLMIDELLLNRDLGIDSVPTKPLVPGYNPA